jgi:hypothetical protein
MKRITKDLYEIEDYEDKGPIDKTQTIEKQTHLIDKQQDKIQIIITDDDFESNLKGIIEDNKDIENDKQNDNQQVNDYSPSFKLISKRRK